MIKKYFFTIVIFCLCFLLSSCNINKTPSRTQDYPNKYRFIYTELSIYRDTDKEILDGNYSFLLFVPCGETIEQFVSKTVGNKSVFYDCTGQEITDNRNIATGMIVKERFRGEYLIVVKGDVNGDGAITYDDSELAQKYLTKEIAAPGAEYLLAADVDTSFSLTDDDVQSIQNEVKMSSSGRNWYDNLQNYQLSDFNLDFCNDYLE